MTDTNAMREAAIQKLAEAYDCEAEQEAIELAMMLSGPQPAIDAILALLATDCAAGVGELRGALIDMGRQIGCALSDEVSTEFLTSMLPEELRLWREANASPPAPADASEAIKLAEEYAAKRDWNGAYHTLRCAVSVAPADASGEVERLRDLLRDLERSATAVHRKGATTGPHWSRLGGDLIRTRAALAQEPRP